MTARRKRVVSIFQKYLSWCRDRGLAGLPATYHTVAGYIVVYVTNHGNSTKSVSSIISALKVHSHMIGVEWLSDSDKYKLASVVKNLEYHDTKAVQQKSPITVSLLLQMFSKMNLNKLAELLTATAMAVCHDALLRPGELLGGLTTADIMWDWRERSFTIMLYRSKANRKGGAEHVKVNDYPSRYSAFKLLSHWYNKCNLVTSTKVWFIFPHIEEVSNGTNFNFYRTMSNHWWKGRIQRSIASIGLDINRYSGHSFRAGGATDLFVARVPYPTIKKAGRWKSDAALRYYRDEVDVADAVAQAFGSSLVRGVEQSK